ncbi:hypothetical protein [uncultured Paludibaculum sp.]|uniref:hypothetical protein n=1 Tax=uncultured Paludibaculum sp. TaxID=1765020 RepID=UPI002AAB9D85|nr:hypothetical protein [uncultured Paludibaculum sp.]
MKRQKACTHLILAAAALSAVFSLSATAQSAHTTRMRSPGHYSRNTTATGAYGKTANYNRYANWGNGSYSGGRSVTGFNGRSATANTTASVAPGSASRQTTVATGSGRSATYQNNATWGNGVYSDTKSIVGANGKSATSTVQRTDSGMTKTVTGPNGELWTTSRTRN